MLKEFSDVTPFSDTEAIAAGKQLINAKVPLDELRKTLLEVGDVAAGSGVAFGELAEIYAKNKMSGVIQMEDVNQLAGRGIPIMDELARVMGVGADQIRNITSSGAVKFEHLRQAFANMSKEGGVYSGMMDRLSTSGEGLSSTFDSKLVSIKKTMGSVLLEGLKPLLSMGINFLDWIQKSPAAMNILKTVFVALIPVIGSARCRIVYGSCGSMGVHSSAPAHHCYRFSRRCCYPEPHFDHSGYIHLPAGRRFILRAMG
jgi:tape measure domain-containing protein